MGWYLRDVHPGKRDVSGSLKRQMAKLIGGMAKKKKMKKTSLCQNCRSDFLLFIYKKKFDKYLSKKKVLL